jgi:hypothetical protein
VELKFCGKQEIKDKSPNFHKNFGRKIQGKLAENPPEKKKKFEVRFLHFISILYNRIKMKEMNESIKIYFCR